MLKKKEKKAKERKGKEEVKKEGKEEKERKPVYLCLEQRNTARPIIKENIRKKKEICPFEKFYF